MSASQVQQDVQTQYEDDQHGTSLAALTRTVKRLHINNMLALSSLWLVSGFVVCSFVAVIILLIIQGFPYLINPAFYAPTDLGVGKQIFNTFYVLLLCEVLLFPIALSAAIFTVEYARQGRLVTIIRFAAETLAGVPTLVLGLFGVILFGAVMGFGISRLSGALTLLCLNLPVALRLFEDALLAVPREQREASLALGCTKWHTIRTVVLPTALPGLITGLIITAGKVIGETAALVFTMGVSNPANSLSPDTSIPGDTLTIHLWYIKTQGAGSIPGLTSAGASQISAGSAALLIIILLVINIAARSIGRYIQRRVTAA